MITQFTPPQQEQYATQTQKKNTKVLAAIVAVVLIICCIIGATVAVSKNKSDFKVDMGETVDSGICGDNVTWTLDDNGNLIIEGSGPMYNYKDYVFPNNMTPWRDEADSIEKCVIKDGVTSIGDYAFYNCTNLTAISVPDSVISIGSYAFFYCESIKTVTIPDGVTEIELGTFWNCTSLESVVIPDSVTKVFEYAFHGCESLKDLYYGGSEGDVSIGNYNEDLANVAWHYNSKG